MCLSRRVSWSSGQCSHRIIMKNTIAIRSSIQNVRIYISGELRRCMIRRIPDLLGKNSASGYVFCETSSEDADRKCGCDLQCFTKKSIQVLSTKVYCGDKSDIWAYRFHSLFYGNSHRLRHAVCRTGRADH